MGGAIKNKVADLDENLFKIGADSLLAARFVAAINARCGIEVRMKEVFMNPSINALTKLVDKRKNTVVYIFGDNENEIRDVLIEKLSASNISCKRVGGQEIIERCHEDISVKKKYIIAFSEMASLCITKASELLGENIIITISKRNV